MPIIDIIQSYVIKGFIILIIVQAMISLQQILYERSASSRIEQEMFTVSSILSSDIRCVGSDTVTSKPYFLLADSNAVTFKIADSSNFGSSVQIGYYLSNARSPYLLNRSINGGAPSTIGNNIERFFLSYYDSAGALLNPLPLSATNCWKVRSVGALIIMRKTSSLSDSAKSIWQSRIYPYNL